MVEEIKEEEDEDGEEEEQKRDNKRNLTLSPSPQSKYLSANIEANASSKFNLDQSSPSSLAIT